MNLRIFILSLTLSILVNALPAASQKGPPRLIVRADDMGFAHAANTAIMKTVQEGIATSVEVLVPAPWFPEAVAILAENPAIDVGIHLTLTSEWGATKFRPVSQVPSLTNEDGYFHAFIHANNTRPGQALQEHKWKIEEIEKEFRAQIELALKKIPHISHISAHMGCYTMSPEVAALTKKLVKEYGIDIDPEDFRMEKVRYLGPKGTTEEKIESIIKMLESLKAGKAYFFVDHPGLDSPELRAISHKVAIDRQEVTNAWTDERVKEAVRRLGIQLISYKDLSKLKQ